MSSVSVCGESFPDFSFEHPPSVSLSEGLFLLRHCTSSGHFLGRIHLTDAAMPGREAGEGGREEAKATV